MDSTALALTLIGFGLVLIALSYQRHRHRRNLAALGHGVCGALLFLSGTVLFALGLNFNTYDKLTPDQALAELSIEQTAPQIFQARLMRIPAGDLQVFTLKGDHWQMQAQLLQWRDWAHWLGLDANIRLEQLRSTAAIPVKSDNSSKPAAAGTSYQLSHNPGISLWDLQRQYPEHWLAMNTQALQTDSYALEDGMRFHIELKNGALTARIINQPKTARRLDARTMNAPVVNYQGVASLVTSSAASASADNDTDHPAASASAEPLAAKPPTPRE